MIENPFNRGIERRVRQLPQDFSRPLTLQHSLYRPNEMLQDVDPGRRDAAVPQRRGGCLASLAMLFEVGINLKLQAKR